MATNYKTPTPIYYKVVIKKIIVFINKLSLLSYKLGLSKKLPIISIDDWTWWNGLSVGFRRSLLSAIGVRKIILFFMDNELEYISDSYLKRILELRRLDPHGFNFISGKGLDLSPLSNLINLERLDLRCRSTLDISPLSNLINLEQLDLSETNISDISPLSNLIKLKRLDLSGNRIKDPSPLDNLPNLIYLNLENNKISDKSWLKGNNSDERYWGQNRILFSTIHNGFYGVGEHDEGIGRFDNNKKVGWWKEGYWIGKYVNDRKDGEWKYYKNNRLYEVTNYKNGIILERILYKGFRGGGERTSYENGSSVEFKFGEWDYYSGRNLTKVEYYEEGKLAKVESFGDGELTEQELLQKVSDGDVKLIHLMMCENFAFVTLNKGLVIPKSHSLHRSDYHFKITFESIIDFENKLKQVIQVLQKENKPLILKTNTNRIKVFEFIGDSIGGILSFILSFIFDVLPVILIAWILFSQC